MAVYLITYDLGKDGDQDYAGLIDAIRSIGPAIEVTQSSWFVSTTKTGEEVATEIESSLCDHDKYFLFDVGDLPQFVMSSRPHASTDAVVLWLELHAFGDA